MERQLEKGFRPPTVCRIVGISYRQLDYWSRTNLVVPSLREAAGSGTQRLYSFEDLVRLRLIAELLEAGISLQRARKALAYVEEHDPSILVSDGRAVGSPSLDLLLRMIESGRPFWAVSLLELRARLEREVLPAAG
jgi:DNA-binding transcriptional MerR regulator